MKWHRLLVGLLLCGLLSTLVAACGIYDVSAVHTGPTVHMGATDFLQPSITIHQGDSLTLVDDAASTHIINNGTWVNGVAER
jgi:plastocyanin